MRELSNFESLSVAGGEDDEINRTDVRDSSVELGLIVGPFVGWRIASQATVGMSLAHGWAGAFVGAGAGIIAMPLIMRAGAEIAIFMHDLLITK